MRSTVADLGERAPVSPICRCLHRLDLELARRIHEALIPESISHPNVDVGVLFQPRDRLGGDYCQAIFVERWSLYLTICDVTGHGIGSAMLTSRVSMIVRGLLYSEPSPREILETVDSFYRTFYSRAAEDLPLSFLAARLDLRTGLLTYTSAGHPGPLVVRRRSATCQHYPTQNLLIGVADSCILDPTECQISLERGDRIALFSDGITDASCGDCRPLGLAGLARLLLDTASSDVFHSLDQILDAIECTEDPPERDDRTMILVGLR